MDIGFISITASPAEKAAFRTKYEISIQDIKQKFKHALVSSGYTLDVKFDAPMKVHRHDMTMAVDMHYVNIQGTHETIRVVQPKVHESPEGLHATLGSIISPLGKMDLHPGSLFLFESTVQRLAEQAGLPWPIRLTKPRPVGNAPYDPDGERWEDYLSRYQMDLNELGIIVERMLCEHRYQGRYLLESWGQHELRFNIEQLFHPAGKKRMTAMIHLIQPTAVDGRFGVETKKGSISTPYLSAEFDCVDFMEVFQRVISDFANHEAPDVVAAEHARIDAMAKLQITHATFPPKQVIDDFVLRIVQEHGHHVREIYPRGSPSDMKEELVAFRKAFCNRMLSSPAWGHLPTCQLW